jgi:hypothetical protein
MSIISVLTDPGKGGTFLNWSVHFLAGHTQYYFAKDNKWIDLPNNPLTKINAHVFKANQPLGRQDFCKYLDSLLSCKTQDFHSLYFHNFLEYPYSNEFKETKKCVDQILPISKKIIVLTNQYSNLLYEKSYRSRTSQGTSFFDANKINVGDMSQFDDYIRYFFAESLEIWKSQQLTEIWDTREFMALNYRHHAESIAPLIDLSVDHYSIDCIEWFTNADSFIENLCDYLEILIDPNRLTHWHQIYQSWRKIHYQRLNFLWSYNKIVDYIVTGKYMDLTRFELDLYQESIIQHELIYKHNLNLKTFNLVKFKDTQQLHHLLEPNIHDISKRK